MRRCRFAGRELEEVRRKVGGGEGERGERTLGLGWLGFHKGMFGSRA